MGRIDFLCQSLLPWRANKPGRSLRISKKYKPQCQRAFFFLPTGPGLYQDATLGAWTGHLGPIKALPSALHPCRKTTVLNFHAVERTLDFRSSYEKSWNCFGLLPKEWALSTLLPLPPPQLVTGLGIICSVLKSLLTK